MLAPLKLCVAKISANLRMCGNGNCWCHFIHFTWAREPKNINMCARQRVWPHILNHACTFSEMGLQRLIIINELPNLRRSVRVRRSSIVDLSKKMHNFLIWNAQNIFFTVALCVVKCQKSPPKNDGLQDKHGWAELMYLNTTTTLTFFTTRGYLYIYVFLSIKSAKKAPQDS